MPTGYTAKIYEGKQVSGEEFLMDCARAFGACITMRDEPVSKDIPEEFQPSTYHLERLEEAKLELDKYLNMTEKEAQVILDNEYQEMIKRNKEGINHRLEMKKRYLNTLTEVRAWSPPTDEHKNLKEFAVNQLIESIERDCSTSYYEKEVTKLSVDEWLNNQIARCQDGIAYQTKEYDAEVERTNGRNKWIKDLRNSFK